MTAARLAWPEAGAVHVWTATLRPAPEVEARLYRRLDVEEQARAERFRFPGGRQAFTAARGVLRELLGAYLDVAPERLVFAYGGHGKPELAAPAAPELRFNVSHSGDAAVFAFTRIGPIGVDVERLREVDRLEDLARRFFSPRETAALLAMPRAERRAGFFRCWTRKEAFVKAHGAGLTLALDSFDVTLRAEEPPRFERLPPGESLDAWRLAAIPVPAPYVAAVAVRCDAEELRSVETRACEELPRPGGAVVDQ